jgi:hypothetical protein
VTDSVFDNLTGVCGGAIRNGGSLFVRNSTFSNSGGFFSGGAICNTVEAATATIEGSTFSNNAGGGTAFGAGAIHNRGGTMTVVNSAFVHNTSSHDQGGAIRNAGTLSVRNSVFFQNDGGAGAAIYIDGGNVTIRNSVFIENAATGVESGPLGGVAAGHGGAIDNHGGQLMLENSLITDNTAVAAGGGVYTCCNGTTTLKRTIVIGNTPDNTFQEP